MGYFDGLTDASFKEDEHGNSLFYPFGIFGKGRIIPNDREKQSLRYFLKSYYQIFFLILIALIVLGQWKLSLILTLISIIPFNWVLLRKIRNYEYTDTKLTFKESSKHSAHSHSKLTLWFLLTVCLLFVFMGISMAITSDDSILLGVLCSAFFSLCALSIGYMIKIRS